MHLRGKFRKTVDKKWYFSLKTFPHLFLWLKEEVKDVESVEIFALTNMKLQDQIVPIFLVCHFVVEKWLVIKDRYYDSVLK